MDRGPWKTVSDPMREKHILEFCWGGAVWSSFYMGTRGSISGDITMMGGVFRLLIAGI